MLVVWALLFTAMGLLGDVERRLKYRIFHELAVHAHNKSVHPVSVSRLAEAKRRIIAAEKETELKTMEHIQKNLLDICDLIKEDPCDLRRAETCPSWRPGCYNRPTSHCPPWKPGCNVPIPPKMCWFKPGQPCPHPLGAYCHGGGWCKPGSKCPGDPLPEENQSQHKRMEIQIY